MSEPRQQDYTENPMVIPNELDDHFQDTEEKEKPVDWTKFKGYREEHPYTKHFPQPMTPGWRRHL